MQNEGHALREAATALRDDMLMRAEMNKHLHDGEIVVDASNGIWLRFNKALIAALSATPPPAPIDNEALVEEVARAIKANVKVGGPQLAARAVLALPSIANSGRGQAIDSAELSPINQAKSGRVQSAPSALVEEAIGALEKHHNWHLAQAAPDPEYGYIPATEYADSSLCEETLATLAKLKEGRA